MRRSKWRWHKDVNRDYCDLGVVYIWKLNLLTVQIYIDVLVRHLPKIFLSRR